MKVEVNQQFWNKSNWLGKTCFIIGAFFMDLAMKLSGFEQKRN